MNVEGKKTKLDYLYQTATLQLLLKTVNTDLQDKFLEIEVLQLIPAFFIVNNLTFRKKIPNCQYLPLLLPTDQSQRSLTVQGVIVRL